jgi:hypothetical protein
MYGSGYKSTSRCALLLNAAVCMLTPEPGLQTQLALLCIALCNRYAPACQPYELQNTWENTPPEQHYDIE